MTRARPSSETVATAGITLLSLVGGLAVACLAGAGLNPVTRARAQGRPPALAAPSDAVPATAVSPALDSPHLPLPADAVVDVKAAYQARGDGASDDTAALQRAINEHPGQTIYLPTGTYLVSRALEPAAAAGRLPRPLRLVGADRNATTIKLKDGAVGFGDRANPRPVLQLAGAGGAAAAPGSGGTGSGSAGATAAPRSPVDAASGGGPVIENVTVDTGRNLGAVGVDYAGGTLGAVRRVTVVGRGVTGLAINRARPGPALVSKVAVRGFDYGIRVGPGQYGLTFEHLSLIGQRVAGLDNAGGAVAIRDLSSGNTVPAVRNADRLGLVTLVDAVLTGGRRTGTAVDSAGEILARNVRTGGYGSAVRHGATVVPAGQVAEYVSRPRIALFPDAPARSLRLAVAEPPDHPEGDLANWASVQAYGARPDDERDDAAAIQQALDSGKPVVYLPPGRYLASTTLHLHGRVQALVGFTAILTPTGGGFADRARPTALIEVDDGAGSEVSITGLTVAPGNARSAVAAGMIAVVQHTGRPLVLRDFAGYGDYLWVYHPEPGAGALHLENVAAARWRFDQPQQVWAHQLGPTVIATGDSTGVINSGATVWILGLWTERAGQVLRTERGGRTELLGGALYESGAPGETPFDCVDASISLSFATVTGADRTGYRVLVHEQRAGTSRELSRQQAVWRGDGRLVPLYVG